MHVTTDICNFLVFLTLNKKRVSMHQQKLFSFSEVARLMTGGRVSEGDLESLYGLFCQMNPPKVDEVVGFPPVVGSYRVEDIEDSFEGMSSPPPPMSVATTTPLSEVSDVEEEEPLVDKEANEYDIGTVNWRERLGGSVNLKTTVSHLKALEEMKWDLKRWVDEASSNGLKRVRCLFILSWAQYTTQIDDSMAKFARETLDTVKRGVAECHFREGKKSDEDYSKLFEKHAEYTADVLSRKTPVNAFNLFGFVLPSRRCEDASTLMVFDSEKDDPDTVHNNSYYKDNRTIVFRSFKTHGVIGDQWFVLEPSVILEAERVAMAVDFLNTFSNGSYVFKYRGSKPDGRQASYTNRFKTETGLCINDCRHFWASKGREGTKKYQLAMARFLAHSPSTQVGYAINEIGDQPGA
jgi:hypothetical protein